MWFDSYTCCKLSLIFWLKWYIPITTASSYMHCVKGPILGNILREVCCFTCSPCLAWINFNPWYSLHTNETSMFSLRRSAWAPEIWDYIRDFVIGSSSRCKGGRGYRCQGMEFTIVTTPSSLCQQNIHKVYRNGNLLERIPISIPLLGFHETYDNSETEMWIFGNISMLKDIPKKIQNK